MKKSTATLVEEIWNVDCPECNADHKFGLDDARGGVVPCSECGCEFQIVKECIESELLAALKELKKQIFAHHKMNVKKDYSLLVADAAASKAINKAEGR